MAVSTGAGATLALTPVVPAAENWAAYDALTYVEAGEVSDLGELPSRVYQIVPWRNVTHRGLSKAKGGFSYTPQTITLGMDPADAGQVLLDYATDQAFAFTIRIKHPFLGMIFGRALIMGGPKKFGDVSTIATRQITLEYTSLLRLPANAITFGNGVPLLFSTGEHLEMAT